MKHFGNKHKNINSLLFQLVIVFLMVVAISFWLRSVNIIRFPDFIENIISSRDEDIDTYTQRGYEIFEHISTELKSDTTRIYPSLDSASLKNILDNLDTYDNFFWQSTSTTYFGNKEMTKHCKSRISGNRYNIEILDINGRLIKKCLCNGHNVQISDTDSYFESAKDYKQGIIDFYSDASVISIDYFKKLDMDNIPYEIYRITDSDYNLLSVSFEYQRNGVTVKNNFLVSLDFGVVLFADSYENDVLVYKLITDSIYSLPYLDDEIFIF